MTTAAQAGVIGAGVLSVLVFPFVAVGLQQRKDSGHPATRPGPIGPADRIPGARIVGRMWVPEPAAVNLEAWARRCGRDLFAERPQNLRTGLRRGFTIRRRWSPRSVKRLQTAFRLHRSCTSATQATSTLASQSRALLRLSQPRAPDAIARGARHCRVPAATPRSALWKAARRLREMAWVTKRRYAREQGFAGVCCEDEGVRRPARVRRAPVTSAHDAKRSRCGQRLQSLGVLGGDA